MAEQGLYLRPNEERRRKLKEVQNRIFLTEGKVVSFQEVIYRLIDQTPNMLHEEEPRA